MSIEENLPERGVIGLAVAVKYQKPFSRIVDSISTKGEEKAGKVSLTLESLNDMTVAIFAGLCENCSWCSIYDWW